MYKFLKTLLCRHNYTLEGHRSMKNGDAVLLIYKCPKCQKTKTYVVSKDNT